jgi:hypothetical protein
MRSHHIVPKLMLLGVGGGIAAYMFGKKQRAGQQPEDRVDASARDDEDLALDAEPVSVPDNFDVDPADPLQSIDEVTALHVEELGYDAMSTADAQANGDINVMEVGVEEEAEEDEAVSDPPGVQTLDDIEANARDVGDLYGVHTPRADDRQHLDGDASMDEGQNWIEALEEDSVEGGPTAEVGVEDVVDDDEVYAAPHASDSSDTPVADRGSGGPAGI